MPPLVGNAPQKKRSGVWIIVLLATQFIIDIGIITKAMANLVRLSKSESDWTSNKLVA
jgi:hypothetical protein